MNYYLLVIWGGVEPGVVGPFKTEKERDDRAKEIKHLEWDKNGLFTFETEKNIPEIEFGTYSGGFFNDEEDLEP